MPDYDNQLPPRGDQIASSELREEAWDQAAVLLINSRRSVQSPNQRQSTKEFQAGMEDLLDDLSHDARVSEQAKEAARSFVWVSGADVPLEIARAMGAFREPALDAADVMQAQDLYGPESGSGDPALVGDQHGQ